MGGTITELGTANPSGGNWKELHISIQDETSTQRENITYDINKDEYDIGPRAIERRDAVFLAKIAAKVNPDTRYKEVTRHFKIKGY